MYKDYGYIPTPAPLGSKNDEVNWTIPLINDIPVSQKKKKERNSKRICFTADSVHFPPSESKHHCLLPLADYSQGVALQGGGIRMGTFTASAL